MEKTGIDEAVEAAGGDAELARLMGVTRQFLQGCRRRGYVPYGRARQVEHLTKVDRRRLVDPIIRDLFD